LKFKIEPWLHQKKALELSRDTKAFAFFHEMGAGKTATVINLLRYKFAKVNRVRRTIIFCPPIVRMNWVNEFKTHSNITEVYPLLGAKGKRVKEFKKYIEGNVVFVCNYESLLMKELFDLFCTWKPEILIWDESHKLKSHSSKRTKAAIRFKFAYGHLEPVSGYGRRRNIWKEILSF
jgi:SNF2 family DNA or RNA helicase